ncbi:hypothetical protein Btru_055834 [Bulinus truncatus]|nr:hypothetical protein Btru_055834 [Bulinus truncatus]
MDTTSKDYSVSEQSQPEILPLNDAFERQENFPENNNDRHLHLDRNANKTEDSILSKGDGNDLSTPDHISIFQLASQLERKGNFDAALQNYLKCLKGLKSHFFLLPHCLHKIADIYYNKGEYELALQFAQAENLCYETSPIINDEIQSHLEEIIVDIGQSPMDLTDLNLEALRADEFELMAKDYSHKKQLNKALEYAGKCAKTRQQIYGDNHEKTKSALNLFKSLYADEKIQQYIGLKKLCISTKQNCDVTTDLPKTPEIIMSAPAGGEPVSILRQRSEDGLKDMVREKKQVHFHYSVDESIRKKERDQLISSTVRFLVLAAMTIISATIGAWLYCYLDRSLTCQEIVSQFYIWSRSLQQYFNFFTTSTSKVTS